MVQGSSLSWTGNLEKTKLEKEVSWRVPSPWLLIPSSEASDADGSWRSGYYPCISAS